MKRLMLRILLIIPWLFLIWFISLGISGSINILLMFLLLFILIPGAVVVNLITVILVQGRQVMKIMRDFQNGQTAQGKKLESTNYSDLPWWNPRKYM